MSNRNYCNKKVQLKILNSKAETLRLIDLREKFSAMYVTHTLPKNVCSKHG